MKMLMLYLNRCWRMSMLGSILSEYREAMRYDYESGFVVRLLVFVASVVVCLRR